MTREERVDLHTRALEHLSVNEIAQLLLDKATLENLRVTIHVKFPKPAKKPNTSTPA